jgi:hypothetical protein
MESLWRTSLWIPKSRGQNNKLKTHQENIFRELVWITTIITFKEDSKLKKLKVKNKTIKWDTAKISDLKIKMFWHIWIIEHNNQRIYCHQAMDKRLELISIMVEIKILRCQTKGKAKVQGDRLRIQVLINNKHHNRALLEETTIKFLVIRCKTISLFKILDKLLSSKWGNQDMLRRTK